MNPRRILQFCAAQEAKLDHHLFAREDEEQSNAPSTAQIVTKAGLAAALGGAALAHSPRVNNRLSGMRATVPGFAQRNSAAQRAIAAGSVAKEVGGAAIGATRSAAAGAVTGVTRAVGRAGSAYTNARSVAGLGVLPAAARAGKKAINPLLGGLKRIAKIGA